MRYFTLLDFQHWILALFFGLLTVILMYLAWGLDPEAEKREGVPPGGNVHGVNPVPPFLIVIIVGAILWALGYAVVEGICGP